MTDEPKPCFQCGFIGGHSNSCKWLNKLGFKERTVRDVMKIFNESQVPLRSPAVRFMEEQRGGESVDKWFGRMRKNLFKLLRIADNVKPRDPDELPF